MNADYLSIKFQELNCVMLLSAKILVSNMTYNLLSGMLYLTQATNIYRDCTEIVRYRMLKWKCSY